MKDPLFNIALDITRTTMEYAKLKSIPQDEAMRVFLNSATFRALHEPETGLCFEMFESVYDMFLEEVGYNEL
ncbi:MAG: hypothetical protein FWD90_14010 [Defluviitaleaceae bacterium]|nr:hypothetical protein [Defluviitaleaceae bacterium]